MRCVGCFSGIVLPKKDGVCTRCHLVYADDAPVGYPVTVGGSKSMLPYAVARRIMSSSAILPGDIGVMVTRALELMSGDVRRAAGELAEGLRLS